MKLDPENMRYELDDTNWTPFIEIMLGNPKCQLRAGIVNVKHVNRRDKI